jgi:hypothetical protein
MRAVLAGGDPELSIIVIGYRMSRQLANTLYTLSTDYQREVSSDDYEVIVVENSSDDNIDERLLTGLGGNFHFFRREESGQSPVPAVNFAFSRCRGRTIGLVIDGARMVTPRVIRYALLASRMSAGALTVVPGYLLGEQSQELNVSSGYDERAEQALLDSIDWRADGYRLFSVASLSKANRNGYLQPMMECNCLFAAAERFARIGYADARFDLRGGGAINLHIYRSLGLLPDTQLVVLPGEGSFHQYHGGVTTSEYDELAAVKASHRDQLQEVWDGEFSSLRREPMLLGAVTHWAQPWLQLSLERAARRFERVTSQGLPLWGDDP